MNERLQRGIADELARSLVAPSDDLVTIAVQRGRRQRRLRRTIRTTGATAVIVATVVAGVLGVNVSRDQDSGAIGAPSVTSVDTTDTSAATAPAPVTTGTAPSAVAAEAPPSTPSVAATGTPAAAESPTPSTSVAEPTTAAPTSAANAGEHSLIAALDAFRLLQQAASDASPPHWTAAPSGLPATPQGELQLFAELSKGLGKLTDLHVGQADPTQVSAHLTTPDGRTGSVQFMLLHDKWGHAGDCLNPSPAFRARYGADVKTMVTCTGTSDGGYVVHEQVPGNCIQHDSLDVVHPDGTAVFVNLSTCLTTSFGGQVTAPQILSPAQAESIFTHPGFDFTMPADVLARAAHLGSLSTS